MKIILLEDVKSLGKKDQIVEVSDGYARNFILPKKLGLEANAKNMNDLKLQKANEDKKAQQQLEEAKELAALLETKEVVVKMKAGEGGKTFGSISSKEIAVAAKVQCGLDIDKKKIQIPDAIKSLGVYEVQVKLHTKVTAKLRVKVEEEGK
jgi:large subunit ribosomal protein L9